jgi:hypothetical protein
MRRALLGPLTSVVFAGESSLLERQPPTARFRALRLALLAGALVVLTSMTACKVTVEEVKPRTPVVEVQRTAMAQAVSALPDFDAAVSAVDFDPPIRSDTILRSQRPVKLLAAVENSGTMPLYDLRVEAFISSQGNGSLLHDWVTVEKLAPGETRVVEFQQMASLATLPKSSFYRIGVTVGGRQPDANPKNNIHEVIVRVGDY